jgi:MFS family permease
MKALNFSKLLYFFLFSNTVIAGLFNFLIPLYLYDKGFTFSDISFFIALNSLVFFICLFVIEYLINKLSISLLVLLTFGSYAAYISSIFFFQYHEYFIIMLGVLSGIYLSLFWILQRYFFLNTLSPGNIGRQFGNLQIFVGLSSQIATFLGAYLLEFYDFTTIYIISMSLLLASTAYGIIKGSSQTFKNLKRNTFSDIINFKDASNSKRIFIIDGIFLFLESHFWLLIIFLFAKGNFFEVGKIITLLAIIFFAAYVVIKNKIDRISLEKIWPLSIILYAASWILRYVFVLIENPAGQYLLIYLIGFLTLFFRLSFNKIFFEKARSTSGITYILMKSYYSQAFIFVAFLGISVIFQVFNESILVFNGLFIAASALSFMYLEYNAELGGHKYHEKTPQEGDLGK